MAINSSHIVMKLRNSVSPTLGTEDLKELKALHDLPVEVYWPDEDNRGGETRRVMQVSIENSGTPEKPTLRLICGRDYED